MKATINRHFGTWRGLVRSLLAYGELASGRLRKFDPPPPETVKRVVFVCLGNICRSAYAHQIARQLNMNVASLGLSTTTGGSSPDQALASAARLGIDMHGHRSVDWSDFKVAPGDLFLVMEVHQAHELRRRLGARQDVHVCLLGRWCQPVMPHLHDPFTLSDEYFDTCFRRVSQAVHRLNKAFPHSTRAVQPAQLAEIQ